MHEKPLNWYQREEKTNHKPDRFNPISLGCDTHFFSTKIIDHLRTAVHTGRHVWDNHIYSWWIFFFSENIIYLLVNRGLKFNGIRKE